MIIKDLVKMTATFLGKENVLNFLINKENYGDAEKQVDLITRGINVVINELAISYVPMTKKETITSMNGEIAFSSLSESLFEVINVTDLDNNDIYFSVKTDKLEGVYGKVVVNYRYIPSNYGLTDSIGYVEKQIPSRVIAYGVAAEVSLSEHNFNESVVWRKRFTDSLTEMIKPKNVTVKKRRWE